MLALVVFGAGLAAGSFLDACISRLPDGRPLFAWPSGCRSCGAAMPARRTLVMLLTGGLFVWCLAVVGPGPELAKALILTCFLLVITFIDLEREVILDRVLLWLAGAGVAINIVLAGRPPEASPLVPPAGPLDMLAGGLLGGGLLLLIAIVSRGGLAGGDIKFAAALGLWFGWRFIPVALVLSFLFGGVGSLAVLVLRLKGRKDMIPYGPFIAAGAFVCLLYGPALLRGYLQHYQPR